MTSVHVLRALPAAIALAFSQAAMTANINPGGNRAQLPADGVPTAASSVNGNSVSGSVSGNALTVSVTGRAAVDWPSFNVAPGYTVNFSGSGAAILNRVTDIGAWNRSNIGGTVNGQNMLVMLMNPNGITFASGSLVNVGALVATTGTINVNTFMTSGNVAISGAVGSIENFGQITATGHQISASNAGLVALVAPSVANHGTIAATAGKILLAGTDTATISMNGGLYEFAVATGAGANITNAAGASLTGATIHLSTGDAANLLSNMINLDGVQQATGAIVVNGGTVALTSALQAPGVSGNSNLVNVHSGGGRVQDGVNVVQSGGTVNVAAGTFAENVSITKALTLDGAGQGLTIIDPVGSNTDAIVVSGNIGSGATVAITDLTVQGGKNGIRVADNTTLGTITLDRVVVRDNAASGFISSNGNSTSNSTVTNVNILNSVFAGNGVAGGSADINLFNFNGDAVISNVDILGTRSASPNLNAATDYGLQIRGSGNPANVTAAGHVTLDNVRIAGNYRRAHLGVQRYSDAGNLSMSGVVLGGSLSANTGDGTVAVAASNAGFGTYFSSDMHGAISLGDTRFAALANANPLDINIGGDTAGLRVDATHAVFDAAGSNNFAIEDRVAHALDAAGIGGLVTWRAGNVYVTTQSGSIQRGINAATSGDTVNVGAGTFAEQLTVNKSLSLLGAGANITTVTPGSLAADASGMRSILTIGGGPATDVEVGGFTFKGPVPEINAGIFVRDGAHARIHDNRLIDIRESAALSGNQRGVAIYVGRALLGTSGTAVIENNVIAGYQKGGIVIDGPGSQATVTGNIVTGEGPTGITAQNGIQISRGASANVSGNTVSGNSYTGPDEATGILIFTPGVYLGQGNITIGPNAVAGNEVGIWTNDPSTLTSISLAGVSGNARNGVADFAGGYAGQGALLEYPAWAASNAAQVSAATFGGSQSGDIANFGGVLRVSGWSGFAAVQPAVNAVAMGGVVNVDSGTYAESVVLNQQRNLIFDSSTIQGLTINAGAAGSGIGGSVTANGATGFLFGAPVVLLSNTSLSTAGANIALNSDIQNAPGGPYSLSLAAGSGNISLTSGGSVGNPLGTLTSSSNNFTLTGTLWVSGYAIDAAGVVALSDHTLRQIGSGATNTISAGDDVIGSTVSESAVQIQSGGDIVARVTAPSAVIDAAGDVQIVLQTSSTVVHARGNAELSGSSTSVVLDAPGGSVTGSFGQVSNTGTGLINVNGKPEANTTVSSNADNNRVVPSENTLTGTGANSAAATDAGGGVGGSIRMLDREAVGDTLDQGESVELDLAPGKPRRR